MIDARRNSRESNFAELADRCFKASSPGTFRGIFIFQTTMKSQERKSIKMLSYDLLSVITAHFLLNLSFYIESTAKSLGKSP